MLVTEVQFLESVIYISSALHTKNEIALIQHKTVSSSLCSGLCGFHNIPQVN